MREGEFWKHLMKTGKHFHQRYGSTFVYVECVRTEELGRANVPQSAEALLTEELPYSCLPYQFTNNKPRGIRNEACVDS